MVEPGRQVLEVKAMHEGTHAGPTTQATGSKGENKTIGIKSRAVGYRRENIPGGEEAMRKVHTKAR